MLERPWQDLTFSWVQTMGAIYLKRLFSYPIISASFSSDAVHCPRRRKVSAFVVPSARFKELHWWMDGIKDAAQVAFYRIL
mmetsp:Transcript_15282/g.31074  ORF Transcript_15282/g.31074 Transcript_15282/m.31074 type:complete len:81 (+) Transcript_15282:628-870(+)